MNALTLFPRIHNHRSTGREVPGVARRNPQTMVHRGGCDQAIRYRNDNSLTLGTCCHRSPNVCHFLIDRQEPISVLAFSHRNPLTKSLFPTSLGQQVQSLRQLTKGNHADEEVAWLISGEEREYLRVFRWSSQCRKHVGIQQQAHRSTSRIGD